MAGQHRNGFPIWAMGVAIAEEFVRSWDAEVLEYDITPTEGTITLALPFTRRMRTARALDEHVSSVLVHSEAVLEHSLNHVAEAHAWLEEIRARLAT